MLEYQTRCLNLNSSEFLHQENVCLLKDKMFLFTFIFQSFTYDQSFIIHWWHFWERCRTSWISLEVTLLWKERRLEIIDVILSLLRSGLMQVKQEIHGFYFLLKVDLHYILAAYLWLYLNIYCWTNTVLSYFPYYLF